MDKCLSCGFQETIDACEVKVGNIVKWMSKSRSMTSQGQGCLLTFIQGHSDSQLLFLKNSRPFGAKFHMKLPWDFGMKIVQTFRVTWSRWLPGPYMVKNSIISFFRTKRTMTLKLGIQHWVLNIYHICSNDDTEFTLTIFMTWSNLFLNTSAWVKVYTTYNHVFPSLF